MDKLEQYRHAIKKILTEYYEMSNPQNVENGKMEASERLAFDENRDQYIWFRFGWDDKNKYSILSSIFASKTVKFG